MLFFLFINCLLFKWRNFEWLIFSLICFVFLLKCGCVCVCEFAQIFKVKRLSVGGKTTTKIYYYIHSPPYQRVHLLNITYKCLINVCLCLFIYVYVYVRISTIMIAFRFLFLPTFHLDFWRESKNFRVFPLFRWFFFLLHFLFSIKRNSFSFRCV